ncbi:MAG: hypothetical protein AAF845_02330 [Bacteroidota bacterium]
MSAVSLVVFLALVALVCGALVWGVRRVAPRRVRPVGIGLGLWLGATAALAASGVLSAFDAVPPRAPIVLLGFTGATAALAFSRLGATLAQLPLWALVGVQAFRAPLEWLLHRLWSEGVLPVQVTYAGWNYDIATGLLAVLLALALWRSDVPRRVVGAWNGLGLALLGIVVATAALSLPTPFQQFAPSTEAILTVPLIWLPAVLVQAAFLGHLLVIRRLRADAASGP